MKGYFLLVSVFLAVLALSLSSPVEYEAAERHGDLIHRETQMHRIRRSTKCDFRACDQLCRRLKFPGGACIGDKCDCDKF